MLNYLTIRFNPNQLIKYNVKNYSQFNKAIYPSQNISLNYDKKRYYTKKIYALTSNKYCSTKKNKYKIKYSNCMNGTKCSNKYKNKVIHNSGYRIFGLCILFMINPLIWLIVYMCEDE